MGFEGLTGIVITPIDPKFEEAIQKYNKSGNENPVAIVYCRDSEDVSNAICWSKDNSIKPLIVAGGQNNEEYSIDTGNLIIDTSLMDNIEVDTIKSTAKVQAGTSLKRLYEVLYDFGYAFPGGMCSTAAISDLVKGGGIGLSVRYLGLTIDSLLEIEIVDAKGNILTANKHCNQDLFWALRGAGGGNFGVVTSYKFRLIERVEKIALIQLSWKNNKTARFKLLKTWQNWLKDLDRRVSAFASVDKQGAYLNAFFYGEPEEGKVILKPILDVPGITFKRIEYIDFIEAVKAIEKMYPKSEKFQDTGRFVFKDLSEQELKNIIRILDNAPAGHNSFIKVYSLGGAVRDTAENDTSFFYRNANYIMAISSMWEEEEEEPIHKTWLKKGSKYLKYLTTGSYVKFPYNKLIDYDLAHYGEFIKRLENVKAIYDPDNEFSFPQSIGSFKTSITKVLDLLQSFFTSEL